MNDYYKVGGSLNHNHPTYVIRKADQDLFNLLKAGDYCFVLNCRQMGKSSLKIRTARKLRSQGFKCASIDLTLLGSQVTLESWYKGLASELLMSLELELDLSINQWWQQYDHLTELQRFKKLLDWLLKHISQHIVIFLDEIDTLINIPFKDDFFAFIRACYNQRSEDFNYNRLNFCLLGVAAPADLIQDKERTPFNIGHSLELTGLNFTEAKDALLPGLENIVTEPEIILQQILYWSGGQPFLTQKLCSLIVQHPSDISSDISKIVQQYIIEHWETQDEPEHLRTIRSRLLYYEPLAIRLLGLYQQILTSNSDVLFNGSDEQTYLRLSGLVVKKENSLQVYNPIYQAVFNLEWVKLQLDKLRPYRETLNQWLQSKQNPTYLLKGTLLLDAQQWAKEKSLSDIDYQFLSQSQQEQDKKEKEILEKAYQKSSKILTLTIAFAFTLVIGSIIYAQHRITKIEQITHFENLKSKTLDGFKSQQIQSLITAITASKQLKQVVNTQNSLADYPTVTPISTLLTILGQIQEYNQWEGNQESISSVVFSPDGKMIASGSRDEKGTIKLWKSNGNLITTLYHQGEVSSINFTPNGKMLISGSDDGTLKFWTLQGHLITTANHNNPIYSFSINPDGNLIASGGQDGRIKLWNKTGKLIKSFIAHQHSIYSLSFSPNGELLASGSGDGTIKVWTKEGKLIKTFSGHKGDVNCITFNDDGKILASGSADQTIKLWSINGQLINTIKGHQGFISSVDFSPDGSFLVSSSFDKTIKLWNKNGTPINSLLAHANSVSGVNISPDGKTLVSSSNDGTLKLWKSSKSALSWRGHQHSISRVSISSNGKKIVSGDDYGSVKLWHRDGHLIKVLPYEEQGKIITSLEFSTQNNLIVAGNDAGNITLWNEAGEFINSWNTHQGTVNSLIFNADEKLLITGGDDGTIQLWNLDGKRLKVLFQNNEEINNITRDSQGKHIISSTPKGTITIHTIDKMTSKSWETKQPGINFNSLSISPNGEIIASGGIDGTIKLWSKEGKQLPQTFEKQVRVTHTKFSNDGKMIITGHQDGTVKLWTIKGKLLLEINQFEGLEIPHLNLSADSQTIVATDGDLISVWSLNIDELLKQGCAWLTDYWNNNPQSQSLCQ